MHVGTGNWGEQVYQRGGGGGPAMNLVGGKWLDPSSTANEYATDAQAKQSAAELAAKNSHWSAAFGALQGVLGNFGKTNPYTIGGSGGSGPNIDAGPTWNPQQIDQQVNATRAQNDAATGSRLREMEASTAGRGFGSNSPLLMAMENNARNANLAANTENERSFRMNAAQENAGQILKGQSAREAQYASRQDESIRRAAPYWQSQNAIIAALAGLA